MRDALGCCFHFSTFMTRNVSLHRMIHMNSRIHENPKRCHDPKRQKIMRDLLLKCNLYSKQLEMGPTTLFFCILINCYITIVNQIKRKAFQKLNQIWINNLKFQHSTGTIEQRLLFQLHISHSFLYSEFYGLTTSLWL